ncbi:MAG: hypothetical protein R3F20_03525 [Planctomycetota bacterium]
MFSRLKTLEPLAAAILALAVLSGCGKPAPGEPVADPRAYCIEAVQKADLRAWWGIYRNPDPEYIGAIVDEAAEKDRKGMPAETRGLDRFVQNRVVPKYKLRMEESDEGKAFILARAQERYDDPPTRVWDKNGRFALLDYHVLPGTWKTVSRTSEGLKDPPAVARLPFLKPAVLARSLELLMAAHPEAKVYQVRYAFHFGSELKTVIMEIVPDAQLVYREGGRTPFTAKPMAWKDLLAGRVDLEKLDWDEEMEGYDGPDIHLPPREILPLTD